MAAWTTTAAVIVALGPGAAPPPDDEWLTACVDAANAAAYRKRREAGYDDDDDAAAPAPSADVAMAATRWALALFRARASTDSFASFEEIQGFAQTFGDWPEIKRLLGIGRAVTDRYPSDVAAVVRSRRRRRLAIGRWL